MQTINFGRVLLAVDYNVPTTRADFVYCIPLSGLVKGPLPKHNRLFTQGSGFTARFWTVIQYALATTDLIAEEIRTMNWSNREPVCLALNR